MHLLNTMLLNTIAFDYIQIYVNQDNEIVNYRIFHPCSSAFFGYGFDF